MFLQTLKPARGSTHKHKRRGRGSGSGRGTFSGRGAKGQKARAGGGVRPQFEGGQTPLTRRQPKFQGFKNPGRDVFQVVNLEMLEAKLAPGTYDAEALRTAGIIRRKHLVKILGKGSVTKKFALKVDAISRSAKKAIEAAGGSVILH